jgi:hypothetical protein
MRGTRSVYSFRTVQIDENREGQRKGGRRRFLRGLRTTVVLDRIERLAESERWREVRWSAIQCSNRPRLRGTDGRTERACGARSLPHTAVYEDGVEVVRGPGRLPGAHALVQPQRLPEPHVPRDLAAPPAPLRRAAPCTRTRAPRVTSASQPPPAGAPPVPSSTRTAPYGGRAAASPPRPHHRRRHHHHRTQ